MQARLLTNGRIVTAFIMLLIFVSMSLLALGFPEKARLMPLMVGVPGSILAFVQLLLELPLARNEIAASDEVLEKNRDERKEEKNMFLWLFIYFIGILCFGFLYAAPFIVFGFLYKAKQEGLKTSLISAVATWVVLFWGFQTWFEITLFRGLVLGSFL
jgi:uncharacterized membrane protein